MTESTITPVGNQGKSSESSFIPKSQAPCGNVNNESSFAPSVNNSSIHSETKKRKSPFAPKEVDQNESINRPSYITNSTFLSKSKETPSHMKNQFEPHSSQMEHSQNSQFAQISFNKLYPHESHCLMGIDTFNNCVVIFKDRIVNRVSIDELIFKNKSEVFTSFNEFCKWTNVGNSLIVTGGCKKMQVNTSFLLHINEKNEIEVENLPNMFDSRDRHNLVYLPDKNSVLACGGILKFSSEILDLKLRKWNKTPPLNNARANSTSLYYNNRYVYLIGGMYILLGEKRFSKLDSIEMLDVSKIGSSYVNVEISNYYLELKSLMGVFKVKEDKFLLFGGFDDKNIEASFEMELDPDTGMIKSISNSSLLPPKQETILNPQLLRISNDEVATFSKNFEVISFNFSENRFKCIA